MNIEFRPIISPRTEDGGFGSIKCYKCGAKTTGYLNIILDGTIHLTKVILCVGCLSKGIEVVHNAMRESYVRAGKNNR